MRVTSENWWLAQPWLGKSLFQGRSHLCRQRGRFWHQGRKGFICRTCCSSPEVTDGVISLFNGPELIPLKHFCCCQEFIWLCWSHFHEEQREAGMGSNVDRITVHCSRGWRYLIHNHHFSSPHCTSTTWKKKKSVALCKILFGRSPKKYSHCRTEINDILCLSNKHFFCHKAFVAFK